MSYHCTTCGGALTADVPVYGGNMKKRDPSLARVYRCLNRNCFQYGMTQWTEYSGNKTDVKKRIINGIRQRPRR